MSRIARSFPQQPRVGGPTWHVTLSPPQAVLPLPTIAMQTVTIKGVAVQVRVAYPRRVVRHLLIPPNPPHVFADVVSGSAAATGAIVEAYVGADTQQGTAPASSGTLSEATVIGLRPPVIVVRIAGNRRGHVYMPAAQLVTATHSTVDATSGAAAPSGSLTEGLVHSPSLSGSASPTGSVAASFSSGVQPTVVWVQIATGRRNAQTFVRAPMVVRQSGVSTSDVANGAASPSGSVAWAEIHVSVVSGAAAPSGFTGESFGGPTRPSPVKVVSLTVAQSRSYRWKRRVESILFAPMVVSPPAVPLQRTIGVTLAGRTRVNERRRRGKVQQPLARVIGPAVNVDVVTGSAAASGSVVQQLTHAASVSGAASSAGTVVQTKVYTETRSGSASASGSLSQAKIGNDLVSGASSATGSSSDSFSVGLAFQDNPSGVASPSGTRAESLTGTNSVSGTQTAAGTIVEQKVYPDVVAGVASPSGTKFFEQHVWNDTPTGVADAPSGVMTDEALTVSVFTFGSSSATGSLREKLSRGSGPPVHFKTSGWRNRWSVKLRV